MRKEEKNTKVTYFSCRLLLLYFILHISTFVLEVFKDAQKIATGEFLLKMH